MAVFNSWNGQQGGRVPPDRADHRPEGDRGQRPGDGLRQHGRQLGHRRRLHPRPEHRRERLLRRLPDQRPGRGRRRRHPHARSRSASSTSEMPKVYEQLLDIRQKLETHYKEMQDIEFTVQDGTLYMLQTRTGKRTGTAAVRIAVEMVKEGLIDETTASSGSAPTASTTCCCRSSTRRRRSSRSRRASPPAPARRRARSSSRPRPPSSTPRSTRTIRSCWSARRPAPKTSPACTWPRASSPPPAARPATRPSSPAAGASPASSAARRSRSTRPRRTDHRSTARRVKAGDFLTINGTTGDVMIGKVPTVAPTITGDFATLMAWADKVRTLKVRTNADTPEDAAKAREFGAEGIGLCRTEHMFFGERADRRHAEDDPRRRRGGPQGGPRRARAVPEARTSSASSRRWTACRSRSACSTRRCTSSCRTTTQGPGRGRQAARHPASRRSSDRVEQLHEFNPMLGLRGCRLPIVYPEIGDMQVRAIIEAAIEVKKKGKKVLPEIMIPLVGTVEELAFLKKRADRGRRGVHEEGRRRRSST